MIVVMTKKVKKVLAYVTRPKETGLEVLVFEHVHFPEAGIQVPAGTLQENESLETGALREIEEEVGLKFTITKKYLGEFEYDRQDRDELHLRNVFEIEAPPSTKDSWIHTVKSHDEDNQLQFKCYWLPLEAAQKTLAAEQGNYLHLL